MTDPIRIPNVAVFEDCHGTKYRQITSYAEVTPDIARQIVASVVPEDMHRLCLELDKAKFMARLEALEDRTSAIAEIQRDDHEKGMAGRISALEKQVDEIDAIYTAHCRVHDMDERRKGQPTATTTATPPADDAAVEGVLVVHGSSWVPLADMQDIRADNSRMRDVIAMKDEQHSKRTCDLHNQIVALRAEVERLSKGYHESCFAREEALKARVAELERHNTDLKAAVQGYGKERDEARADLAALKGRKVKLPAREGKGSALDYSEMKRGYNIGLDACADAIRAAGVEVDNAG
jgi:hypothetical protein